jgi:hypothetical protein
MARITLGELLDRNPNTITCNNLMPDYYNFQPLDGTSIPIETYDRMEIVLTWERVYGDELTQLLDIIESTQGATRAVTELTYDDDHLLVGDVVIMNAVIQPIAMTGGTYNDIPIDLGASVTITVAPNDYTFLQVI